MRILVLNYEYPPLGGGAGAVTEQLARHFVRRGHAVDVVTMAYADLPRQARIDGISLTRVPAWRRRPDVCGTLEMASYVASALPRVRSQLAARDHDVIHCHFVLPTGLLAYLATRGHRTPYVLTSHGSDIPGYNPDRFRLEYRFVGPLTRLILRNAAGITAPSAFLREFIREACGSFDVDHIPNGIDVARLRPGKKQRRILMTGRLLPGKGFQHVLEALRTLDADVEIHIAGDGPFRGELEARARSLAQPVTFHGWLEHDSAELARLYETASIFCLPSVRENASISLLEAMSAGMAVVSSTAPGCAETLGEAGFAVAPGDVDALRDVLKTLLDSESARAEAGQRARRRVEERFDWSRIGDRYLERLARACGASHGEGASPRT